MWTTQSSFIQVRRCTYTRSLYDLRGCWVLTIGTGKRSIYKVLRTVTVGWLCVCLTLKKVHVFCFCFFYYPKRIRIGYGIFTTDRTFSDLTPPVVGRMRLQYCVLIYNTVNRPYNARSGVLMATAIFNARYDNVAYTFFFFLRFSPLPAAPDTQSVINITRAAARAVHAAD